MSSFAQAFSIYISERDALLACFQNKTIKLTAANANYTASPNFDKNLMKVSYECKMAGVFDHFILSAKESHSMEDLEEDIRALLSFIGFISDNMAHEREQAILYTKIIGLFSNAYERAREIDSDVADLFYEEMEDAVQICQNLIESD